MSKIRVLLADDHAILRAGLRSLLNSQPDMEVAGEASTGAQAIRCARELMPDIVLLDITMCGPDGLEAVRQIRSELPATRVLALTMHDNVNYLREVLEAGGSGYVLKRAADTELLSALRAVHQGGTYLHTAHTRALLHAEEDRAGEQEMAGHETLSERELQVLRLIAEGHSNRGIAEELGLSVKTVETYRARIMEKLGLRGRVALVRYALRCHLIGRNASP
ncbi:MAG: response regulator transcription factor [Anaerolineae bacterium]|nr:response regulator transcription factor [Anaerolineae bacterium]